MARGLSTVNLANAWLNVISGTTFTGAAGSFVELHTADPGASGTTAVSSVTTQAVGDVVRRVGRVEEHVGHRVVDVVGGHVSPETVTDIADFSASSAGTFYFSVQLTASKTVQTGDTLTLNTLSVSLSPLAA
jgi:NADPH-dependent curcumin reductase CurA